MQVINPRGSLIARDNRNLIPRISKGQNKQLARHSKQAGHTLQAKTQTQILPRGRLAKAIPDSANPSWQRGSGKASPQSSSSSRRANVRQEAKSAVATEPGEPSSSEPRGLSFLDGDCVHANKALFLEGRVSQYRRCAPLLCNGRQFVFCREMSLEI